MNSFQLPKPERLDWEFPKEDNTSSKVPKDLVVFPSQWVQYAIRIFDPVSKEYVNFPFTNRDYLKQIYDCDSRRIILNFGRQSEKSTTLGNIALTYCCLNHFFHALYVAPTNQHVTRFSKDRLDDTISISPRLKAFTSSRLVMNVLEKGFVNNSRLILRSCYNKPDSVRGIRADLLMIDEIASIITDHIPIIEECLSHSTHKKRLFAGTPLVTESAAGYYWNHSTQNEWAIPCYNHIPTHWNILSDKNIGKTGLICDKCGNLINPYDSKAQWVSAYPNSLWTGFRIPQIMVPGVEWDEILKKRETYGTQKFKNEVMAEFADVDYRPVTRAELIKCCQADLSLSPSSQEHFTRLAESGYHVYAGIDWGSGSGETPSYTVLALGSYFGGDIFKIFYLHRFEGPESDPLVQLSIIESKLRQFKVKCIGADYGFGFVQNAKLQSVFADEIMGYMQFYYSLNPKKQFAYSKGTGRYILHRSQMMSNLFNIIKMGKIAFPKWEDFETFSEDFLNVTAIYNDAARMIVYDHAPDHPDDTVHAVLYCLLASFPENPRPDLLGIQSIPTVS